MESGFLNHLVVKIVFILFLLLITGCSNHNNLTTTEPLITDEEKINIPGEEIMDIPTETKMTFEEDNITLQFSIKLSDKITNLMIKTDVFNLNYYVTAQIEDTSNPAFTDLDSYQEVNFDVNSSTYTFSFHINIDEMNDSDTIGVINQFKNNQIDYIYYKIIFYDYQTKDSILIINTYCADKEVL